MNPGKTRKRHHIKPAEIPAAPPAEPAPAPSTPNPDREPAKAG